MPYSTNPKFIGKLRSGISGTVVTLDDSLYDSSRRLWNAAIERTPLAIVYVQNVAEIRRCIELCVGEGIQLSVRSTGHNVSGRSVCNNGVVIDLSSLRSVVI